MRLKHLVLVAGLVAALSACAIADATTQDQRVYAIESQLVPLQKSVLAYIQQPDTDPVVKRRLKELELTARQSVEAASAAAQAGQDAAVPALITAATDAVAALASEFTADSEVTK
jgi:hypothetical protein